MSDRRRSQRTARPSGSSSATSSHAHRSSTRPGDAPSNGSSTSLHRGGDRDRDRDDREPRSSSRRHHASSRSASSAQPQHPIYGSGVGGGGSSGRLGSHGSLGSLDAASASRYSLTDQFAATRSVLDFGFDDAASSIFDADADDDDDAASVYSVSTVRGGDADALSSSTPTVVGGSSPWADDDDDDDIFGGSHSLRAIRSGRLDETVLVGYSTVLEQEAAPAAAVAAEASRTRPRTPTNGNMEDNDDDDLTDREQTPKRAAAAGGKEQSRGVPRIALDRLDDPLAPSAVVVAAAAPKWSPAQPVPPPPPPPVPRTHYDVLCLAGRPHGRRPSARPAQVRAAYLRLVRLLNSSTCNGGCNGNSAEDTAAATNLIPASLRPIAAICFAQVQEAFETLIDPARRLAYDRYLDELEAEAASETESETEVEVDVEATSSTVHANNFDDPDDDSLQSSTDLGLRYGCTVGGGGGGGGQSSSTHAAVLDYAVTHSVQAGLPALGRATEAGLHRLLHRLDRGLVRAQRVFFNTDNKKHHSVAAVHCGTPVVRLVASTYAVGGAGESFPPLADRFQPLLPEILGPARLAQLARTRSTGCVVLAYRQAFTPASSSSSPLVVDVQTEVLPQLAVTARAARAVPLRLPAAVRPWFPAEDEQKKNLVNVEVMVQQQQQSLPRLGLGLSRRIGRGAAFVCADSGNHAWWRAAAAHAAAAPSGVSASLFAPLLAPMAEVGYTLGPGPSDGLLGLRAGGTQSPLTGPADRGLKGVEADLDAAVAPAAAAARSAGRRARSSWTVSAAVCGSASVATYVRYGRTVFLTPLSRGLLPLSSSSSKPSRRSHHHHAVRVEAELCAADWSVPRSSSSDGYLAVRALAPVRWWGLASRPRLPRRTTASTASPPRLGLELAISPGSGCLHVSLYWAHLRQRLKLPLLFFPSGGLPTGVLVWAAAATAALVARELAPVYLRAAARMWRAWRSRGGPDTDLDVQEAAAEDDEREERAVARHRAEADELSMVLAAAVDAQRVVQRQLRARAARTVGEEATARDDDGLVILSAKYGVALEAGDTDDASTPPLATRNGWAPDYEVADVTAAVAALVVPDPAGAGAAPRLRVPGGLRKGYLLGFWDPAPHYRRKQKQRQQQQQQRGKKVLHVRYLWRGEEHVAEVGEHQELRLP